ncbi:MAG: hypothetical protein B6D44_11025 [Ignavibacteriales bacterium UTCHB2]|jgi:hypothetical protein|nr:MAG: hypothetical protein B6D44_11025 [Ignavibacteriales bacterium UTCHB2]
MSQVSLKSKRKKELSLYEFYERLMLKNNDNYLFSIDEARLMLRMGREKFVNEYIKGNKDFRMRKDYDPQS